MKQLTVCFLLGISCIILVVGSACNSDTHQPNPVIAVQLPATGGNIDLLKAGLEDAAAQVGVALLFASPVNNLEDENTFIESAIKHKVVALIITPVASDGSIPDLIKARQAGITVVCFQSCVAQTGIVQGFVAAPDRDLGKSSGDAILEFSIGKMNGKAVVGMINCTEEPACSLRRSGFISRMSMLPGIKTIDGRDIQPANPSQSIVEALLNAHPEIDLLWAADAQSTALAVQAVSARSLAGSIPIFGTGIDSQTGGLLSAKDGILQGVSVPLDYQAGYDTLYIAKIIVEGKLVPEQVNAPTTIIKRGETDLLNQYIERKGRIILSNLESSLWNISLPGATPGTLDCNCIPEAHPVIPTPP